jgi:hypothetical protein
MGVVEEFLVEPTGAERTNQIAADSFRKLAGVNRDVSERLHSESVRGKVENRKLKAETGSKLDAAES